MDTDAADREAIGLGIDVGGTNTDAVLLDLRDRRVLSVAKAPTTRDDLSRGVADALARLDRKRFPRIALISLSTTLATNAIVEGVRRRVLGVLIGYGPDQCPAELRGDVVFVDGGHDVRGEPQRPLDVERLRAILREKGDGVDAFAVCGYFSVRNPEHEQAARALIRERTNRPVVCGHEISLRLDAGRRAVTTILNAHLIPVIHDLLDAMKTVFRGEGIDAPLMVVKGDGSLMAENAIRLRPIETVLSGPAASVIGARHLSNAGGQRGNAIVVDIGGTTTDMGLLRDGMPRLNTRGIRIGPWQTNVLAIDLQTIGLGGDSHLTVTDDGLLRIGPKRVVPLSWLGMRHPDIEKELLRMEADRRLCAGFVCTDFWLRLRPAGEERLGARSHRILETLAPVPLSLYQLSARTGEALSDIQRDLVRLEHQGFVQAAGITPTDVLHVTGEFSAWHRSMACTALRILCRRHDFTPAELVRRMKETMDRMLGLQAMGLLLSDRLDLSDGSGGCGLCRHVWNDCFFENPGAAGLRFRVALEDPLIGIGAPVHAYLPSLANKTDTTVHVPPHAEVANAVGAIVGAIVVRDEVVIRPHQGAFRLFTSSGVHVRSDLDAATAWVRRHLAQTTAERARDAGADIVDVTLEEKEHVIRTRGGGVVFLERVIAARATGSPRIYGA